MVQATPRQTASEQSRAVAERMAVAARDLLAALPQALRQRAQFPFPNDEERTLWYYTPTDHGGVHLGQLTPALHQRVHQLVATGLSTPGYVTAATVMGLENILDHTEGWRTRFMRERSPDDRGRDPLQYYVSVFGEPGGRQWGWRFGGHHISLSYTIVDGLVAAVSPLFLGADPAEAPLTGGQMLRPLAAIEDTARDLLHALSAEQRATSIISAVAPADLVHGNRSRVEEGALPPPLWSIFREAGEEGPPLERLRQGQARMEQTLGITAAHLEGLRHTAAAKGLPAARMNDTQRRLLRTLLDHYTSRLPDDLAALETAKWEGAALDALHFAWAGGAERGQPHYYRLQGPHLLVEYDNTQRNVNHIHSVWRDPVNDFGRDVLGEHLATAHT